MRALYLIVLSCLVTSAIAINILYGDLTFNSTAFALQTLFDLSTLSYVDTAWQSVPDANYMPGDKLKRTLSAHLSTVFSLTFLAIVTAISIAESRTTRDKARGHISSEILRSLSSTVHSFVIHQNALSSDSTILNTTTGVKRRWGSNDSSESPSDIRQRCKRRKRASFRNSNEPNHLGQFDQQLEYAAFLESQGKALMPSMIAIESILSSILYLLSSARMIKRNTLPEGQGYYEHKIILQPDPKPISQKLLLDAWNDCLVNLAHFHMALEDDDQTNRETWAPSDITLKTRHFAVAAQSKALQRLLFYTDSLRHSFLCSFKGKSGFSLTLPVWETDDSQKQNDLVATIPDSKDSSTNLIGDQSSHCTAAVEDSDNRDKPKGLVEVLGEYDLSSLLDWEASHYPQDIDGEPFFNELRLYNDTESWFSTTPRNHHNSGCVIMGPGSVNTLNCCSCIPCFVLEGSPSIENDFYRRRLEIYPSSDLWSPMETGYPEELATSNDIHLFEPANNAEFQIGDSNAMDNSDLCTVHPEAIKSERRWDSENWSDFTRNVNVKEPFVFLDNIEYVYGSYLSEFPSTHYVDPRNLYHGNSLDNPVHVLGPLYNLDGTGMNLGEAHVIEDSNDEISKDEHIANLRHFQSSTSTMKKHQPPVLPTQTGPRRRPGNFKCSYCATEFSRQCDLK